MESEERINQRVGRAIARQRKAAGFTQDQVSEQLEIGKEAFSRIERGVTGASVAKLYMLAELFDCGVETFLVEGSKLPNSQIEKFDRMLSGLSAADQQFITELADKLAQKLKDNKSSKFRNVGA